MSGIVVADASALVRAVMDPAAQAELIERLSTATEVLAPSLARVEVANAIWKYLRLDIIDMEAAIVRHTQALALITHVVDEQTLFPEALVLASGQDHPVYDAVYVVTARRHAATLLSFDRRMCALATQAGIASRCLA